MEYFNECCTLDELKKAYYAAAKQVHPDAGGSTEEMQHVNAVYAAAFDRLKREQNHRADEDATHTAHSTAESAGDFIGIINHLLRLDGLTVELCGRWLWIGGDTRRHKDALLACGCSWSSGKQKWFWHFAKQGQQWKRGNKSMAEIRAKYGSTTFTRSAPSNTLPA